MDSTPKGYLQTTSHLGATLSDRRTLLATNLVNSHVRFIRRQINEVDYNFVRGYIFC
jgi:hypothetical protein